MTANRPFHRTTLAATLLLMTLTALLLSPAGASAETPDVGAKAPDFTLSTPEGHPVRLSQLTRKGNVVLVVLRGYPGYDCPYCQRQVHDFLEHSAQFSADHVQVLLVYPGPPADLATHAREFFSKQVALPADFHLVLDPDYHFTNQYELRWDAPRETAYPSTFLIDRHGKIFFRKISHAHGDRTNAQDVLAELGNKH